VVINEGFKFRRQFTGRRGSDGDRNYIARFSDKSHSEVLRTRDISVVNGACSTNGIGVFRTVGAGHRSRWQAVAHEWQKPVKSRRHYRWRQPK